MLLLVQKTAREVPHALGRLDGAAGEEHAPLAVEAGRARGRLRARVRLEPALRAFDLSPVGLDARAAARTVLPLIELPHVRNNRPRAALRDRHRHRAVPG